MEIETIHEAWEHGLPPYLQHDLDAYKAHKYIILRLLVGKEVNSIYYENIVREKEGYNQRNYNYSAGD